MTTVATAFEGVFLVHVRPSPPQPLFHNTTQYDTQYRHLSPLLSVCPATSLDVVQWVPKGGWEPCAFVVLQTPFQRWDRSKPSATLPSARVRSDAGRRSGALRLAGDVIYNLSAICWPHSGQELHFSSALGVL